jgi:hypothetical protein
MTFVSCSLNMVIALHYRMIALHYLRTNPIQMSSLPSYFSAGRKLKGGFEMLKNNNSFEIYQKESCKKTGMYSICHCTVNDKK